ncbi:MAG: hypothetical protein D6735_00125 [Acidobacteria bacterium]|nr:MAG: hypothetical protein D6735_00125 [Acidobacteriota bacterium]
MWFPGASNWSDSYPAPEIKDYGVYVGNFYESGVIPANGVCRLDYVADINTLSVSVEGSPIQVKPLGAPISPSYVVYDQSRGILYFHESFEDYSCEAEYTRHFGSYMNAQSLTEYMKYYGRQYRLLSFSKTVIPSLELRWVIRAFNNGSTYWDQADPSYPNNYVPQGSTQAQSPNVGPYIVTDLNATVPALSSNFNYKATYTNGRFPRDGNMAIHCDVPISKLPQASIIRFEYVDSFTSDRAAATGSIGIRRRFYFFVANSNRIVEWVYPIGMYVGDAQFSTSYSPNTVVTDSPSLFEFLVQKSGNYVNVTPSFYGRTTYNVGDLFNGWSNITTRNKSYSSANVPNGYAGLFVVYYRIVSSQSFQSSSSGITTTMRLIPLHLTMTVEEMLNV